MKEPGNTIACISGEFYFSSPVQCALNPLASFVFRGNCKSYSGTRMIEEASKMFQQIQGAPVPMEAVVDLIQAKLRQLGLIQDACDASPQYRLRESMPPSGCRKGIFELFPLVHTIDDLQTDGNDPRLSPFKASCWQCDPVQLEGFLGEAGAGGADLNVATKVEKRVNVGQDRYVLFRLHEGGFNNQLMSLEIAVGLAHVTGRKLVLYGTGGIERRLQPYKGGIGGLPKDVRDMLAKCTADPSVTELLNPLPVDTLSYSDFRHLCIRSPLNIRQFNLGIANSFFAEKPDAADQDDLKDFADGRAVIRDFEEEVLHFNRSTIAYYSRFFYQPPAALGHCIRGIRFLSGYQELAKQIAEELGTFDGMHVRLTDFRKFRPDMMATFEPDMNTCAEELFGESECLVISTDESRNREFFKSLGTPLKKIVFLEDLIAQDYKEKFLSLPMAGQVGFGLLCNLVMQNARQFVGTPASTYTGMIQRGIWMREKFSGASAAEPQKNTFRFINSGFKGDVNGFLNYQYKDVKEGRYSWNRINLPVSSGVKSWFREWPECAAYSNKSLPNLRACY